MEMIRGTWVEHPQSANCTMKSATGAPPHVDARTRHTRSTLNIKEHCQVFILPGPRNVRAWNFDDVSSRDIRGTASVQGTAKGRGRSRGPARTGTDGIQPPPQRGVRRHRAPQRRAAPARQHPGRGRRGDVLAV